MQEHIAEYIYVVEGERLSRVRVQIQPLSKGHGRVNVHDVHTTTSVKDVQFVSSVTERFFAQRMQEWQRMVSAWIQ